MEREGGEAERGITCEHIGPHTDGNVSLQFERQESPCKRETSACVQEPTQPQSKRLTALHR